MMSKNSYAFPVLAIIILMIGRAEGRYIHDFDLILRPIDIPPRLCTLLQYLVKSLYVLYSLFSSPRSRRIFPSFFVCGQASLPCSPTTEQTRIVDMGLFCH